MAILGLQHIGLGVHDLAAACEKYERLFGLRAQDYRNDQGKGFQLDARILLGNQCWLHLVQNWNPASRVNQWVARNGEGLEHIALLTDSIEDDVAHLRQSGVPIFQDRIFDANDGYEAFVYPEHTPGLTVELIQPHASSWGYPADAPATLSDSLGILQLQHVGLGVHNLEAACATFERLFGLRAQDYRNDQGKGFQLDARILLGNQCWLHLVQNWNPASRVNQWVARNGEGLEHIALLTDSIEDDVAHLRQSGVPIFQDRIFDANDGYEAFVYPEHTAGHTVELIQPHPTSWTFPA